MRSSLVTALLVVGVLVVGCAAPAPLSSTSPASEAPSSTASASRKHITVATPYEPDIRPTAGVQGRFVVLLMQSGLTARGAQRQRYPVLAEAVPSLDNGLWRLLPDGRMETTWRLREGARWHDGVPLTADDLLFSLGVGRDREVAAFFTQGYASIEDVGAPDPRTLTITWKEPFIDADAVLEEVGGRILPRHLLEDAYRTNKSGFLDLPYWTSEFVGAGPYRVLEWGPGGPIRLAANDDYVLGRPKIDEIEVQFIPDANTLSANLLAGAVDLTPTAGSIDLALQLRDEWRGGTVYFNFAADTSVQLAPQFVDPHPAALADLQVRRALVHAIDRQEMVDTQMAGMTPVPHSFLSPNQAAYQDIETTVPHYDYDPRLAAQMLEAHGYRKGPDGAYRDQANQPLELEVRSGPLEQDFKAASAVADYWQRLGIGTTAMRLTPPQLADNEYRATFPSFQVVGAPNDLNGLRFLYSSQTRLASNNYRVALPGNPSRYMNPEFDAFLDTYFRTVTKSERIQALGQVIHHIADQVTLIGLYYNPLPGAVSNRLLNVSSDWSTYFITWNAYQWDVKP